MLKEISASRQYAPLRVGADICFYFYAVSIFSFSVKYYFLEGGAVLGVASNLVSPWSLHLSILLASCILLGLVITRIEKALLRFVLSLLPGICFLRMPIHPVMLILAAAWIYFIVVMTIGSFEVHLDVYRRRVGVMLFAALMLTLCLIIFHFGTEDWYYNRLFGGEIYGLLFFFLSVLSLRGMRTDLGAPKVMRLLDAAYVVVLPALLISVFFLLRSMVPLVTFLFRQLTRFLIWLYHLLFPQKAEPEPLPPSDTDDLNQLLNEDPLLLPVGEDQSPEPELFDGGGISFQLPSEVSLWLMFVFLASVLVFIAIWLIRRKREGSGKPRIVRENVERPVFEGLLRRSSRESAVPSNVRQIRRIYRSYLNLVRSLRMKISPSDTSEDVLGLSSGCLDIPENAALRELYIAARYGDPKAVTARQVSEAKRCLGVIEAAKRRL